MKLTIHNVSAQDSGEYSCEVVGGATTKAKLEIKGKTEDYVFTSILLHFYFVRAFNRLTYDNTYLEIVVKKKS